MQVKESEKWKIRESLCSHPGTDVTGMFARVEKVAGSCDKVVSLVTSGPSCFKINDVVSNLLKFQTLMMNITNTLLFLLIKCENPLRRIYLNELRSKRWNVKQTKF